MVSHDALHKERGNRTLPNRSIVFYSVAITLLEHRREDGVLESMGQSGGLKASGEDKREWGGEMICEFSKDERRDSVRSAAQLPLRRAELPVHRGITEDAALSDAVPTRAGDGGEGMGGQ